MSQQLKRILNLCSYSKFNSRLKFAILKRSCLVSKTFSNKMPKENILADENILLLCCGTMHWIRKSDSSLCLLNVHFKSAVFYGRRIFLNAFLEFLEITNPIKGKKIPSALELS